MKTGHLVLFMFMSMFFCSTAEPARFIPDVEALVPYYGKENVVMITSPGRSGSAMLAEAVAKFRHNGPTLKSHLLRPPPSYIGKVLFIFSSPDKAAESALHTTLRSTAFGKQHFYNVKTSDMQWLAKLGGNQGAKTSLIICLLMTPWAAMRILWNGFIALFLAHCQKPISWQSNMRTYGTRKQWKLSKHF